MRTSRESAKIWAEKNGIIARNPSYQSSLDCLATVYEHPAGNLVDHPSWHLVMGTNNVLTYEDKGKIINMAVHNADEEMLSVSQKKLSKFTIEAEVYGQALNNDWAIPLCANDNFGNTIGIRRSDGVIQVMGRIGGTWGNYHTFTLPQDGAILRLEFDNGHIKAGIPSTDEWFERDVPWTTAHPGIRTHTRTYDGVAVKNYKINNKPCKEVGEYLYNAEFDCGLDGWESYNDGILTDNGNGTVKVTSNRDGDWSGIRPSSFENIDGQWMYEVDVLSLNITGSQPWVLSEGGASWDILEAGVFYRYSDKRPDDLIIRNPSKDSEIVLSKFSLKEYIQPADELLINNQFTYGGAGWTNANYHEFYDGKIEITYDESNGIKQNLTLEVGTYEISFKLDSITGDGAFVAFAGQYPLDHITTPGIHTTTVDFVGGDTLLELGVNTPGGSVGIFDYVSLKKI